MDDILASMRHNGGHLHTQLRRLHDLPLLSGLRWYVAIEQPPQAPQTTFTPFQTPRFSSAHHKLAYELIYHDLKTAQHTFDADVQALAAQIKTKSVLIFHLTPARFFTGIVYLKDHETPLSKKVLHLDFWTDWVAFCHLCKIGQDFTHPRFLKVRDDQESYLSHTWTAHPSTG